MCACVSRLGSLLCIPRSRRITTTLATSCGLGSLSGCGRCCPLGPKIESHCSDSLPHTFVPGLVLVGVAAVPGSLALLCSWVWVWHGQELPRGVWRGAGQVGRAEGTNLKFFSGRYEMQSASYAFCLRSATPALRCFCGRLTSLGV